MLGGIGGSGGRLVRSLRGEVLLVVVGGVGSVVAVGRRIGRGRPGRRGGGSACCVL